MKALVLLFGCLVAHGATVVSVSGPVNFGGSIGNNQAQTAGFTTGQAYADLQISALLNGPATQTFNAYLTTSIGPGTTVADQVAFATVNFLGGGATMTTVFTGLSLPADQYFLTLFNPANTNGGWYSTGAPVVTAAPGSSHNFSGYFITNDSPLPYPPAASFVNGVENGNHTLIYDVVTTPVPEPGTALLTAAGILILVRRARMA